MLKKNGGVKIAYTAIFTALTAALSSFSIPVAGGHLYFCDTAICLAALVLDPFSAFVAGGVGSFLGDMLFYPAPMFVSLVTHGLQAVVIALIARLSRRSGLKFLNFIGLFLGSAIMVTGYTLGRAFVYSTLETSLVKLPFEIFQAVFGAVTGYILFELLKKRGVFGRRKVDKEDKN